MQIIQIIQYAGMMVLHKGTLEDVFLVSLETTAHFNLKKSAHLHSIYSHRPRAQSGAAYRDWCICNGIPDAPLFPVTDHMRNLGESFTLSERGLSLCNTEITALPCFK